MKNIRAAEPAAFVSLPTCHCDKGWLLMPWPTACSRVYDRLMMLRYLHRRLAKIPFTYREIAWGLTYLPWTVKSFCPRADFTQVAQLHGTGGFDAWYKTTCNVPFSALARSKNLGAEVFPPAAVLFRILFLCLPIVVFSDQNPLIFNFDQMYLI